MYNLKSKNIHLLGNIRLCYSSLLFFPTFLCRFNWLSNNKEHIAITQPKYANIATFTTQQGDL